MSTSKDDYIDSTAAPIEESDLHPSSQQPQPDPVLAITVALADELQSAYANNRTKLDQANRSLRQAIRPKH